MLYELKNISKTYNDRTVLDLSLSLEKGKIIGLLGPNGAGKTTLLELLAFLSIPTSGEIWYQGKAVDFNKTDLTELRRSAILVQQSPALFTTSVTRNVDFPLRIRHVDKRRRKRMVQELLRLVGMEEFSSAKAHRLSGGETQRVAMAQALACNPEVIFLDEPTASVDVENQIVIERIVRDINRQKGISVIFTTHDMIQAARLSNDIVFLREGQISKHAYENIFSGPAEKGSHGKTVCVVGNDIEIPVKTDKTGTIRIAIDPGAITIVEAGEDGSDAIKGKLVQLTDQQESIRALVDVGVPLSVLINKAIPGDIRLDIGEDLWIKIAPEKVAVL